MNNRELPKTGYNYIDDGKHPATREPGSIAISRVIDAANFMMRLAVKPFTYMKMDD